MDYRVLFNEKSKNFQDFLQNDQLMIQCSIKATLKFNLVYKQTFRRRFSLYYSLYYKLFNNNEFCNCTLLINNWPLKLHKAMVASVSTYFTLKRWLKKYQEWNYWNEGFLTCYTLFSPKRHIIYFIGRIFNKNFIFMKELSFVKNYTNIILQLI